MTTGGRVSCWRKGGRGEKRNPKKQGPPLVPWDKKRGKVDMLKFQEGKKLLGPRREGGTKQDEGGTVPGFMVSNDKCSKRGGVSGPAEKRKGE